MLEKRTEGYDVHAAGDLNFIRSASLEAAGGNPTVHQEQADWIENMENGCDFHDAQRFLSPHNFLETYFHGHKTGIKRRLDYFLVSHHALERTITVKAIPSASFDHQLLVLTRALGEEKIQGRGLWKHNNALLKEDDYCMTIEAAIAEAKKPKCSDNLALIWDWIKFKVRDTEGGWLV
jgi:hypothetical protein